MTDMAELALVARAALGAAGSATLLISGYGRAAGDPDVRLHDHGGVPTLFCTADSPVARAAGEQARALLRVPLPTDEHGAGTVLLVGELAAERTEQADGVPVEVIRLYPTAVWVEQEPTGGGPVAEHEVPLALYLRACPGEFGQAALRLRAHLNETHHEQLRQFVARHAAVALGEVAGVHLAELGPQHAVLRWVGVDGAHEARLRLPGRARTGGELAASLRARLRDPGRQVG